MIEELSLEDGFVNPPASARPKAYLDWVNGNFSLRRISEELEEAKAKGMGGFDIWDVGAMINVGDKMPAGPPFLGEESLHAIGHTVREAERLGLEIGLTISSSWNAGGSWIQPEQGAMGLFRTEKLIKGQATFNEKLDFPELPKEYRSGRPMIHYKDEETGLPKFFLEVALLAHPINEDSTINASSEIIDLSGKLGATGEFSWEVPEGMWKLTRYVCVPTGQPLMVPSPNSNGLMLDHFSAEAQEMNLNYIIERLQKELGSLENRALKYLYTDSYEVNSAIWTPNLPADFAQENGYSLIPYLPVLDGFTVKNNEVSERFLFDFNKTLSNLIIENHYAKGKRMSNKVGLGFNAEAGGPGKPIHNVPFEDLKALGALSVPRGEFWNKHPQLEKLQIVKGIASSAHIYNQKYVEAEAFTSIWLWQEGPAELKPLADRAICEGLNRFIYHTFPHTTPEGGNPGWVYNFGTLINTTRTWWPLSEGFHNYLARNCYLLQQGNFVGDIAYYYGDRAPNFVKPKRLFEGLDFGYDYDVVNTEVVLEKMEVRDGKIFLPHGQSYEVLLLPNEEAMNPLVLEKIADMVEQGATIIGRKPIRSYSLKDYEANDLKVKQLADALWGDCDSIQVQENSYGKGKVYWGKSLQSVLDEKRIFPDVQIKSPEQHPELDFIHRSTENEEIYFIRNKSDEASLVNVAFRVAGKQPEIWDAESGQISKIHIFRENNGVTEVPLYFERNGSLTIVFGGAIGKPMYESLFVDGKSIFPKVEVNTPVIHQSSVPIVMKQGEYNVDKHEAISLTLSETQVLKDAWEVRFPHGQGAPTTTLFPELISWTQSKDKSIQHFSGIASYRKTFKLDRENVTERKRIYLDLGSVKEVASVYLNGHHLGITWHPPFRFDVTEYVDVGENFLVIELANTLNNRLIGDAQKPEIYKNLQTNVARLANAWMTPFAEAELLASGLLGPVTISWGHELVIPAN
ncbi:MAG: glycosyl hydrolase [Bacteroidota bacterium]